MKQRLLYTIYRLLLTACCLLFTVSVYSQDDLLLFPDSLAVESVLLTEVPEKLIIEKEAFSPNPTKAILYSAIFPGLGQIYNRKYWKLPIVYGGFLGCAYAISWNGTQYNGYKAAYSDFIDDNPNTDSWKAYKPYGFDDDPASWGGGTADWFSGSLKRKKDFYRRNRDLSYIVTIGVYAICMIDAYVDAQLFEFDISPDLSLRMEPVFFEKTSINSNSFGLQCSFTF